jgi:hypothetical protein
MLGVDEDGVELKANDSYNFVEASGSHDEYDGGKQKSAQYVLSSGLTSQEAQSLLVRHGRNELEDRQKPKVSYRFSGAIILTLISG